MHKINFPMHRLPYLYSFQLNFWQCTILDHFWRVINLYHKF